MTWLGTVDLGLSLLYSALLLVLIVGSLIWLARRSPRR
jgi:hypothetical protein